MMGYSRNVDRYRDALMCMWSDVFHDSEEYISLFFDTYFNCDNCRVVMENGKVISMMFAIPYRFNVYGNGSLNGLYLCGLATDVNYRGKGIMRRMIDDVNHDARLRGFDFSFLIPAGDSLRRYYNMSGYVDNIRRAAWFPELSGMRGRLSKCSGDLVVEIKGGDDVLPFDVIPFRTDHELTLCCVNIIHSVCDWKAVIREWIMSGGFIAVVKNISDGCKKCVAFARRGNEGIVVNSYLSDSADSVLFLLSWLEDNSRCGCIKVYDYPERAKTIASSVSADVHLEHYGMCRFLRDCEILKFPNDSMAVRKNQNLTKFSERGEILKSGEGLSQIGISMMLD